MATKTKTKTTDTIKAGQLARIINPRHLAYGRIGMVTGGTKQKRVIHFIDLPPNIANEQTDPTGLVTRIANDELALIAPIPMAAFYLLVTIVERDGDHRHTHQCLAHGKHLQQEAVANSIAQCWYESGGEWDEDENVWRFDTHHFVFAEYWRELTMADYINLAHDLTDCTPGYIDNEDKSV